MSADNKNWTTCPKCNAHRKDPVVEAKKMYGNVPADEYEALLLKAKESLANDEEVESLREEWEIGYCPNFALLSN